MAGIEQCLVFKHDCSVFGVFSLVSKRVGNSTVFGTEHVRSLIQCLCSVFGELLLLVFCLTCCSDVCARFAVVVADFVGCDGVLTHEQSLAHLPFLFVCVAAC